MKNACRIFLCVLLAGCNSTPESKEELQGGVAAKAVTAKAGDTVRQLTPDTLVQGVLSTENPFRLDKKRAGLLRVGMPVQELFEVVPGNQLRQDHLNLEGEEYRVYKILTGPGSEQTALVAEELCNPDCKIWRIRVKDPRYRTDSGIGIGSTYGELRDKHQIKYVSQGEQAFVAVCEQLKASFLLDTSGLRAEQLANLKKDEVPDNVLITGILLY